MKNARSAVYFISILTAVYELMVTVFLGVLLYANVSNEFIYATEGLAFLVFFSGSFLLCPAAGIFNLIGIAFCITDKVKYHTSLIKYWPLYLSVVLIFPSVNMLSRFADAAW